MAKKSNNRRKAFVSMPSPGFNNNPDKLAQLMQDMMDAKNKPTGPTVTGRTPVKPKTGTKPNRKPRTWTDTATSTDTQNRYPNQPYSPTNTTQPSGKVEIINKAQGYSLFNDNSQCVSFDSRSDGSLYENPYRSQDEPVIDEAVTAKTMINVVQMNPFTSSDKETDQTDQILTDIYMEYNREILSNTNGGNKGAVDVFTLDNFKDYIRKYGKLYAYFIELASRMAWATPQPKSNLVCRAWANYLGSDTDFLNLRNDMAYVLADACATPRMMDYMLWYFQVFQQNDHDYSMNHVHMSNEMFQVLFSDTSSAGKTNYIQVIDDLLMNIRSEAQKFSTITALLETKLDIPRFVNFRNSGTPSNTTCYDADYNDIFCNVSTQTSSDGVAKQTYPPYSVDGATPISAAFARDPENVPIHVTEYLNFKMAENNTFFQSNRTTGSIDAGLLYSNKFLAYQDSTSYTGTGVKARNQLCTQVGEDLVSVAIKPSGTGFDYSISPRGLRSYLYEIAPNNLRLAKRRFYLDVFECQDKSQG
jgi:hypothetical protein